MNEINTHNLRVGFGKHRGELWTRIPVSYLKWLVNTPRSDGLHNEAEQIAAAELKRRGTVTPDVEVSGHALDRASLSCRAIWHQTALNADEGLHAWLCRVADEAMKRGELTGSPGAEGDTLAFDYLGMRFVFVDGELYPTLKTVMRR